MRPQPVISFNYCVDYEHLTLIYHQPTIHTQTLEQAV